MDMTSKPSSALSPIVIATATICIVLIGEFIMVSRGSVLFTGRVPPKNQSGGAYHIFCGIPLWIERETRPRRAVKRRRASIRARRAVAKKNRGAAWRPKTSRRLRRRKDFRQPRGGHSQTAALESQPARL